MVRIIVSISLGLWKSVLQPLKGISPVFLELASRITAIGRRASGEICSQTGIKLVGRIEGPKAGVDPSAGQQGLDHMWPGILFV